MANPLDRDETPARGRSGGLRDIEGIAIESGLPANLLLAVAENAPDADRALGLAREMAAAYSPRIRAGEDIQAILRAEAPDHADAIIGRARQIGERLYPEQMRAAREAAERAAQERRANEPGVLGDFRRALTASAVEGVGALAEGAGILADQPLSLLRDDETYVPGMLARGGAAVGDAARRMAEGLRGGMSEDSRRAMADSAPDGDLFDPSTWSAGDDPSPRGYLMHFGSTLGSLMPVIATGVAGRVAAVGGRATAMAAGAVGGAQAAGDGAGTAAGLIEEAFQRRGEDGRSELEAASPLFQELRAQGRSEEEAFAAVRDEAARFGAMLQAPIGAVSGSFMGAAARGLNPVINRMPGGPLSRAMRAGLATAFEEGASEAAEGAAARFGAQVASGMDVDLTEGTFGDFVLGAMGGGPVGAIAGAAPGAERHAGGGDDDDRGTGSGVVVSPEPAAPGGSGEGVASTPIAEPAAGRDEPRLARVRVQLRGERQAWDGEIIGETDDTVQIRADDGQIYDVPRAEIDSGDVILTALEGGGPPPARVDMPPPPAADQLGEDFGIGAEPDAEQTTAQPMTTDDARRLLDAIEARARRQGWDDEMTAAAAQLKDAIERGTPADPALAQSTVTQIGRSDGSPFSDEASARRALGTLGISAGGYDVVLTEGGYVARPKLDLRDGMAGGDAGTRRLGIDDGGASRRPQIGVDPVIRDGGDDPAQRTALLDDLGPVPDEAALGEPAFALDVQQNEQPKAQEPTPSAPKVADTQPVVENIRANAAVLRGVPQDAPPRVPGVSLKWDDREVGFTFNRKHADAVRAAVGLAQPEANALGATNIPAADQSARDGEGMALVTVTDVYGDKHRVRQGDLDSKRRLLPRFNRNGERMDSPGLARDNIDQDGKGVTKTWASSQIIGGGRSADLPLADRSAVRRAILRRGQKVEDFDIKPVRGGMIGVRKAAQNTPAEPAVSSVTAAALQTHPNPTQAQAEAENYRTGKADWNGLTLSVENAKGSTRRGTGPDGTEWSVEMPAHYGRILGTRGADGDHVDFYIGDHETSDFALIVNQIDPNTGSFDEHKVVLGARDRAEAMRIYERGFSDGSGPRRAGSVSEHSVDDLKAWLASGDMTNPTQPVKDPGGKQKRELSSPLPTPAAEANTPEPSPARSGDTRQVKPRTTKAQREREAHLDRLAEYFAPGNIVRTYGGGHDRVIGFDRGKDGDWSATVQAVSRKDDAWVDAPNERPRTHRTEPEARDMRLGPVGYLGRIGREHSDNDRPQAQAQEDAAPQPSTVPAPKAKIEDFGEKIGGAKKDLWTGYAQKLAEAENYDLAREPLSKTWPQPDYEALIREGADPWSVAFVRAARDTVPRKPSSPWKARQWVEQVRVLRGMARQVLSGDYERAQIDDKMVGSASLQRLRNTISLYETFGHAKSLKGLVFRESKYSVYGGQRFPNGKSIWEITQEQKATAFSNMPRVLAKGDSREEAIDAFRPVHEAMSAAGETKDQAKADRRAKFVIWSLRGETPRTYIVGTKIGANHIPLRSRIADVAEARRIVAEEADQLQAQLDRMRDIPRERRETNEPRVGVDHRGGADVTPEMFQEAFGFRGVEFGNYVEGRRRQEDLNNAYDALMDLAGIVGVPSKALSLNGSLGLAFGARGSGGKNAAAAHFEPGKIVINLTKTQGRGALAHEWFHAVDNYFARQRQPMKGTYITDNATPGGASVPGIRPEVVDAFLGVRAAIAKTKLKERSSRIDKLRSSPYWGTGIEMHARAFESYVVAKLQDQSAANDYLANLVNGQMWGMKAEASGLGDSYPYLKPDEIEAVRPAFDALFSTIETRQTESGVAMYSRSRAPINSTNGQADPAREPVAFLSGEELGVSFRGGEDMPTLRRSAQAWYLDNLAGQTAITRDGVEVRFTKRGMRKSVSGNKGDTLLRSVPAIRAIVEKGVVVFREPGRAHVTERIIIAAPVSLAGKTSNLAVSLHRTADGTLQYDFTFNRDAAGRSGDGVPDGHATESRRSAFEGTPSDVNISLWPGEINADKLLAGMAASVTADLERAWSRLNLPDSARLRVVDRLFGMGQDGSAVPVDGSYLAGLAQVALDSAEGSLATLHHEAIHALRDPLMWGQPYGLFTEAEWTALEREARQSWATKHRIAEKYPDLKPAEQIEEAIAAEFAARSSAVTEPEAAPLRRALRKVRTFLRALGRALRGAGVQDADGVFGKIMAGEVGRRGSPVERGAGNPREMFSRAPATDSEAFRAWFGDSKVVDERGEPLVVYHGTRTEFEAFREGVSFFGDKELAEDYALEAFSGGEPRVIPVYLSIKNPATEADVYRAAGMDEADGFAFEFIDDEVLAALKEEGFDGIRLQNDASPSDPGGEPRQSWAAFSPRQVKAASNKGTWDAGDPRMAYSRRPAERNADGTFASHAVKYSRRLLAGEGPVTGAAERGIIGQMLTDAMGGRSSRYSILALVPGEPLYQELAKDLGSARTYLRLKHDMSAMRNHMQAEAAKIMDQWRGFLSRNRKANDALMDLMHDATKAGLDPAAPFSTRKRRTREPQAEFDAFVAGRRIEYEALRARWDAMPDRAQEIYRKVRDAYVEVARTERDIIEQNISEAMAINLKRARQAYEDELTRIDEDGLEGDERMEAEEAAAEAYAAVKKRDGYGRASRLRELRQKLESNQVEAPYFPLLRHGQYFVTVKDSEGRLVSFTKAESEREQTRIAAEARKEFGDDHEVITGLMGAQEAAPDVDPLFVADVEKIIGQTINDPALMDAIWQRYLESLPDFSIRKSRLHRKGTPGYARDAFRNFARQMFHSAHQLARLKHGMKMQMALDDAEREAQRADDPNRAMAIVNEMGLRHDWIMNPKTAAWSTWATGAAFIYYLGVTPAAALVNLSQTVIVGIPVLAAAFKKGGALRASRHLMRGLKEFGTGRGAVENAKTLTDDERAAIREAYDRGIVDKSQAHDLAGVAESGVEYSDIRQRVMAPIAFLFHHTERLNREITFIAAYRMARQDGMEHQQAIDKAGQLTWKTHFNYESDSRPRVQQDDFVRVLTVFRNFQLNMLYRLFRDTHQSFKGKTPEERQMARAQLFGITGLMMLSAGVTGTWGYSLMMTLAGMITPGADSDDLEKELRNGLVNMLGADLAGMILKGVPGHLSGIDLTNRLGMPDLWFRSPDRQLEGDDLYTYWAQQFLGAVPGMAQNLFRGVDLAAGGDPWRGVETAAPKFIRDLMRGWRYSQDGVTTISGNTILERVPPLDALTQALGFTPAQISERYEQNRWMMNENVQIQNARSSVLTAVWQDVRDGGPISARTMEQIETFNTDNPDYPIDAATIRRSVQSRRRGATETLGGVRLNNRIEARIRANAPVSIYGAAP